jgi:hypothetical protein
MSVPNAIPICAVVLIANFMTKKLTINARNRRRNGYDTRRRAISAITSYPNRLFSKRKKKPHPRMKQKINGIHFLGMNDSRDSNRKNKILIFKLPD